MKYLPQLALVVLVSMVAGGCATPGVAEDFKWSIEMPKAVDKGAEFAFTVRAVDLHGVPTQGVRYRYQFLWSGSSYGSARRKGYTGEPEKAKAKMNTGPATMVVTCIDRTGLDAKVLETSFEVK